MNMASTILIGSGFLTFVAISALIYALLLELDRADSASADSES